MFSPTGEIRAAIAVYALERGRTGKSLNSLHYILNSFEKSLDHPANWDDMTTPNLIAWGVKLFGDKLDPETIRSRRGALVGVWRWGQD